MRKSIEKDYGSILLGGRLAHHAATHEENIKIKEQRIFNKSKEFWGRVQDEDALIKSLAFGTIIDQEKKKLYEKKDATYHEKIRLHEFTKDFETFYMKVLFNDSQRPARHVPMDKSHYAYKEELRPKDTPPPQWKNDDEKMLDFEQDFKLYQENKKEQIQRTELFYILEQFYETARDNPDMESEAQNHMRDYFSNPENTYFYDKNKIV